MKRLFFSLSFLTLMLIAACHRDIPVDTILIEPSSATLFIGESINVSVSYYPEDATNLDELTIYSTNDRIATYQNGIVTGVGSGNAAITAACGNVLDQCLVKVYKDKFLKGGNPYGIDYATGYLYRMGTASTQELEITLVHNDSYGATQNFRVWILNEQLGKELDFTQALEGAFVGVYANNNEDGYFVYSSGEGTPMIVTADWSFTDATLTRGILQVDNPQSNRYRIHADFELSNGYRFSTDWEDTASMKTE